MRAQDVYIVIHNDLLDFAQCAPAIICMTPFIPLSEFATVVSFCQLILEEIDRVLPIMLISVLKSPLGCL